MSKPTADQIKAAIYQAIQNTLPGDPGDIRFYTPEEYNAKGFEPASPNALLVMLYEGDVNEHLNYDDIPGNTLPEDFQRALQRLGCWHENITHFSLQVMKN